jgi:DNA-binding transcriptional LysR family regulator
MQFERADLADFASFLTIAKYRSFRRAAGELGISASALSHAMRSLETRTGVRLLNRTNRSVTLTAAGEELHAKLTEPFEAIGEAVESWTRLASVHGSLPGRSDRPGREQSSHRCHRQRV